MPLGTDSYESRIQTAAKALEISPESLRKHLTEAGLPSVSEEAYAALGSGAFTRQDLEAILGDPSVHYISPKDGLSGSTEEVAEFLSLLQGSGGHEYDESWEMVRHDSFSSIFQKFQFFRGSLGADLSELHRVTLIRNMLVGFKWSGADQCHVLPIPLLKTSVRTVSGGDLPILKLKMASSALLPGVGVSGGTGVSVGLSVPIEQWSDSDLLSEFLGGPEGVVEGACSRELGRRSKGGRFLVVGSDGLVDEVLSLTFLKAARKGRPPVPAHVFDDEGRPRRVVGVEMFLEMGSVSILSPLCGFPLVGGFCPRTGIKLLTEDQVRSLSEGTGPRELLRLFSFIEMVRLKKGSIDLGWARSLIGSYVPGCSLEGLQLFSSDPESLDFLDLERAGRAPNMLVVGGGVPLRSSRGSDPFYIVRHTSSFKGTGIGGRV